MNERYDNHEEYPNLSQWEIETLAERAISRGRVREVDYPEDQLQTQVQPHSFILAVDAEPFEQLVEEWQQYGFETVTSAEIEYEQARVLDVGEPRTLPTVYVSVSSAIYDPANPTFLITKDTVFMLPLVLHERAMVKEAYTRQGSGGYESLEDRKRRMLEVIQDNTRNLTQEDVDLLRILLSSE
jgi:hypothetical protein